MKRLLFTVMFLSFAGIQAQTKVSHYYFDRNASSIGSKGELSMKDIADQISKHYKTDKEKLLAAYSWVTGNIRYDTDSMYSINWSSEKEAKAKDAFRRRKGVCENFAAIFKEISDKCGLAVYIIDGYTRQDGTIDRMGHAWCAVNINGQWLLCDPTWDKDSRSAFSYFLIEPGNFISTHMPFDPLWQLLDYPLTPQEFTSGIRKDKNRIFFNFKDSLVADNRLSEAEKLRASVRRMTPGNALQLVRNKIAYNNMKAVIIYEEKDMILYNEAVSMLNSASSKFNEHVHYRNNRFQPARSREEIMAVLRVASDSVTAALGKTAEIGKEYPNLQYDPVIINNRLLTLQGRIEEQIRFVEDYFQADPASRNSLFLK